MTTYEDFVASKTRVVPPSGFEPASLNDGLSGFQQALTRWALRRGRAGIYADTGLGKTRMQVEWARQVVEHTAMPVLIFAPLAVAEQTVREAASIGIHVEYTRDGEHPAHVEIAGEGSQHGRRAVRRGIWITNYELRERFDMSRYAGVALDESSILKGVDSKTRRGLTEACQQVPYLLSLTGETWCYRRSAASAAKDSLRSDRIVNLLAPNSRSPIGRSAVVTSRTRGASKGTCSHEHRPTEH